MTTFINFLKSSIQNNFISAPECTAITTLYLIKSSRKNAGRRNIFRDFYKNLGLKYRFLVGQKGQAENHEISEKLESEILKYNDIILGNFSDNYKNLPLKTYFGYKYITGNSKLYFLRP